MNKIIARGAEAIIIRKGTAIIKRRVAKGYRYPDLDEKLRRQRTRAEARLIEKARQIIPTATPSSVNEETKEITLEYIAGEKIADILDKITNARTICTQIGKSVAKLHDENIVHGDLTTSNMIYKGKKVHIIDFGLGFLSPRDEDKAVDIHVFKEALEARHPHLHEKLYVAFKEGYKQSKKAASVLKQLEKVEKRGRYKDNY